MKWYIFLIAALSFVQPGHSFFSWEDIKSATFSVHKTILGSFGAEFCDDVTPDFSELKKNLKERLFGQDIIINKLIPILETHFKLEPKKALVICMHGWTGSGKNYATQIITEAIFKKKSDSQFVRMFNGRLHFPLDREEYVEQYKINVQNWIRGNVTNCPRTLFVFDEVDKMPPGVIDGIKPFFDYHQKIDSVDFRKSIFIFISNTGGEVINSQYMNLWRQGKSRQDMEYKDFEPYLREALYKAKGGFTKSSVLEAHLVSLYLPFLPLGEEQVRLCITAELNRQKVEPVTPEVVDSALEELEFNYDRFSTSGCKRVHDIVASIRYKRRLVEL